MRGEWRITAMSDASQCATSRRIVRQLRVPWATLILAAVLALGSLPVAARDFGAREQRIKAIRAKYGSPLRNEPLSSLVPHPETPEERLGALLYTDQNLSLLRNQACESCHRISPAVDPVTKKALPALGFVDNDNIEEGSVVSDGSVPQRFGSLNAPSVGYAAFSPHFHWNADEGLYVGGQFWNGRAANLHEQAAQPFLNPVEMAMPSR